MEHVKAIGLHVGFAIWTAVAGFTSQAAHADGFEIAFFNIEHDVETGALEIVHRFFLQDMEIALTETTGQSINLEDLEAVNAIIKPYMEARFGLATLDGRALTIEWGGIENRANTLLIRQSAQLPTTAGGVVVHNTSLHETHPKHVNILQATLHQQVYTRDFLANGPAQKLIFE